MPINIDISWGRAGGSALTLEEKKIVQSPLMMISAQAIETSVTITEYLESQLLRSTLTWKINLRGPKVLLSSNCSLFNTNHIKWIMWNSLSPFYTSIYMY